MPDAKIVRNIRHAVRSLPGWPRLRVLDLSCGDGAVLEALGEDGCLVEGTHFRRDDYIFENPRKILETIKVHEGVDLTKLLPLPAAEYDVVLATEVIEHLPAHYLIYAEVSRILKDGGYFIFTTPNTHRLVSRIQFMLTGQHELRSARLGWHVPAAELYSTHHNPVYFPVVHTQLYQNSMYIQSLRLTQCGLLDLLLLPLYPLVGVMTALELRHAVKRSAAGGWNLYRWMMDVRGLLSEQIMVIAKKTEKISN